MNDEALGCAGRSLFYLEATKAQSSGGEADEPRRGKIWVGRGDPLPATTGPALPPIAHLQSFWKVSPACSFFLLWRLRPWDSGSSEGITVTQTPQGDPGLGQELSIGW